MVYHHVVRSPHSLAVARLYRRVLKEQRNWIPHRHQFNEVALTTREAFRDKVDVPREEAEALMKDCEKQLEYWKHPLPIINIHAEGGVCFQRNAPPPYDTTMTESFVEWK